MRSYNHINEMKRNKYNFSGSLLSICGLFSVILLFSCRKTEDFTPYDENAPLSVTASETNLQLNEANRYNTTLTFNWTTGSNHETGQSITYVLELDKKGNQSFFGHTK